jgi:hypothetical protein
MKGTVFQKPLEFNILVEGESWRQGDKLQGSLTMKNHGGGAVNDIHVHLGYGELKKIRQKAPDAFTLLASAPINIPEGSSSITVPWSFQTDRNASVTDHLKSLFLLYGQGSNTGVLGQLQLSLRPFWTIDEFLKVFEISFKFVSKSFKSQKEGLEVKLAPPQSKTFAAVEQALLLFRSDGEALEVQYTFQVKKVEATAGSIEIKKEKKAHVRRYEASQLLTSSGRFNHEAMEAAIREVLSEVESKVIF